MAPSDSSPVPRQLRLLSFLSRPGIAHATAGQTRSPRFRRAPFERDVAFDPGRASAPRIRGAAQLPSAVVNASAPAVSVFRGSISHPIRLLCTLRRGRHLPRRNTRYQADATPYLGRTLHRLDRASFVWRTTTYSLPVSRLTCVKTKTTGRQSVNFSPFSATTGSAERKKFASDTLFSDNFRVFTQPGPEPVFGTGY